MTVYIADFRKGEWKVYANKGRTPIVVPDWATHVQFGQGFVTFKGDDRVETEGTAETTGWNGWSLVPAMSAGILRPGTWDNTIERSYLIEREGRK
jgi:hypothetical protein